MVLTEKVRAYLGGGEKGREMVVYHVTDLAAGANNISAEALGLHMIDHSDFWAEIALTSSIATSIFPILSKFDGHAVTITTVPTDGAGNSGTLMAWGY